MTQPLPEHFRVSAEWEPQQTVYLAAGPDNEIDPSQFTSGNRTVMDVHLSMVAALKDQVEVKILANADQQAQYSAGMKSRGIDPADIKFLDIAHTDIWIRDTGPIWAHTSNELAAVWMGFNNWGYFDYIIGSWATSDIPNYIPRDLCSMFNYKLYRSSLIGEGGDKSFNGKGSVICCRAVEQNRNPSLSFKEIEDLIKKSFNVKKVIWVDQGLADDAQTFKTIPEYGNANLPGEIFTVIGTGGHVDEYCRFVGPSKILLAETTEKDPNKMNAIDQINNYNLQGDFNLLSNQTDQDGNPLEIIRMPIPPPMIHTIDQRDPIYYVIANLKGVSVSGPIKIILASSYCNYLVSNKVVCFPQYYQEGMDEEIKRTDAKAMEIIQSCFPDHKIIGIDPKPVNAGGGGMHCISNNQPKLI